MRDPFTEGTPFKVDTQSGLNLGIGLGLGRGLCLAPPDGVKKRLCRGEALVKQ
jgi:hypothetical protein